MQSYLSKILLFIILIPFLFFTTLQASVDVHKPAKVTIAYNVGNPPLKFKNNNSQADGILIDIWKLWSKKTGIEVEFKEALFADTLEMLKRGEVDIHAGLFYTKERDKFFDYSSKPIIDISYHIFHHKSISGLFTIDTLRGFKVGVPKGYTQTFMSEKVQKDSLRVYENFPKLYDDVVAENIKTFISPAMNFEYYLLTNNIQNDWRYNPSSLVYKREYMSAVKAGNTKLLKILNDGLEKISDEEIIAIERKWLKSSIKINGTKDTYIISCDSDYAPLTMLNQQGEPAGLYIDLWSLWAKKQNVNVKFLFNTWRESIKAVKEGLADFHSGLEGDEDWQLLSKPFYELKANVYYPVNREEKGIKDFYGKKIGSIDTFYLETMKKSHPMIKTVDAIDYADIFIKLKSGAIDAFMDDELAIKDLLLKQGRQGEYTNVSDYSYISKISAATTKENKKLINFIESGLSKISTEEYLRLEKRWIGEGYFHNEIKKDALTRSVPLTDEELEWLLEHPIIRIGVDTGFAPYAFVDKQGKFQGIAADFAAIISYKLGIKMKMIPGLSWSEIIQASKDKTIDLITTASYRPEREEFLNFTKGYIPTPLVIMTRSDDGRIKKRTDIADLKVALVKEYSSSKHVMEEFKGINVLEVKTPLEGLQAVSMGTADAYVGVLGINIYQANKGGITNLKIATHYDLKTNYQNYGVRKDWPIFASILDKALDSISEDEVNRILQKWTGVQKQSTPTISVMLSDKEKQWLKKHPVIHVGADQNWPPFDFVDEELTHKGIASDYIHLMEKTLGVKFVVRGDEWKKVLKSAKDRELDMLACAGITEPRKEFFSFSKPYVEIDTVIVARKDDKRIKKIEDLFGKYVALPKNNFVHDQLKGSYPKIKYYFAKSNEEAIQAVALGKADAYVGNLAVAGHFIQQHMLTNLEIVSKTPFEKTKLCLTVRKDWPELVTIFNKVLDNVPQIKTNEILKKWLPEISYKAVTKKDIDFTEDEKKWLKNNPMIKIAYMNYWPTDAKNNNTHTDLLKLLNKYSSLQLVPAKYDTWKNGFDEATIGENIHGIMNLSWSKEREEENFQYTKAYNFIPAYLVVKKENSDIKSLQDLENKTVYLVQNNSTHNIIHDTSLNINIIDIKDEDELLKRLSSSNEAQAVLTFTANKETLEKYNLKIAKHIYNRYGEVAIGVSHKHKELQSIINKIYKNIPAEKMLELQNKTYKKQEHKLLLKLTSQEKQWLINHPEIKLGVDREWAPIEYLDENDELSGLSGSLIKKIEEILGVTFVIDKELSWQDTIKNAKAKEIDVFSAVRKTKERSTYLDFTQPYISLPNLIFTGKDIPYIASMDNLKDKKVSIVKGYAVEDVMRRYYPDIELVLVNNTIEGLKKLSQGEAEAFIDSAIVTSHYISELGFTQIKISGEFPHAYDLSLAVRDDWKIFTKILQKTLDAITKEEIQKLYKQNVGIRYEKHIDYTIVWQILLVALLILGVTLYWNRRLSQEAELRKKAEEEANIANEAKSMFLANMSHEIRTPMNAVMGMLYLVQKTKLNDIQTDYISKAHHAAGSLLGIINDILDFSKIEAGKLNLEKVDFELEQVITDVSNIIAFKAEDKGIEFLINHDSDLPKVFLGDSMRLGQILINIANNAVKFTDEGEVVLSLKLLKEDKENVTILFCIKDTGIGMSKDEQEKLFHEFTQVDSSMTRKYGGTGLGLTISKKLVQMMEGKMWIEDSVLGKGSTFCFTLTLKRSTHALERYSAEHSLPEAFRNMRVLIVDDNKSAREVLYEMLKPFKFKIEVAASGPEAIKLLEKTNKSNFFDLVLMDWKMPLMNGIEVSRLIRNSKKIIKQPKIIMVTAYGREDIMNEANEAGLDGFLIKPVTPSLLFNTIMQVLGYSVARKIEQEHETSLDPIVGARILLVEDNELNQDFAVALLTNKGLLLDVAENGKIAVKMVQENRYDAVLMDIQMPVMDGIAATKHIRKLAEKNRDEYYERLPIIAMTALAVSDDRDKSIAAGMNEHVTKPIDPENLFKTLIRLVKHRHIAPVNKIDKKHNEKELAIDFSMLENINFDEALHRIAGDTKAYKRILLRFRDKYAHVVATIQKLAKEESVEAAERKCHEVKGISGNIGADKLFEISKEVDDILKKGGTPPQILYKSFEEELSLVIDSISSFEASLEPTVVSETRDFDSVKAKDLLNKLLESLDSNIADAEKFVDELEPIMQSSKDYKIFKEISKKITMFEIEEARTSLLDLLEQFKESKNDKQ